MNLIRLSLGVNRTHRPEAHHGTAFSRLAKFNRMSGTEYAARYAAAANRRLCRAVNGLKIVVDANAQQSASPQRRRR